MTYDFSAEKYLIRACTECGLEDKHTIAIGKIVDAKKGGYLDAEYADFIARVIYLHADEELCFVGDPDDPWDEDEEALNGAEEMGFDPYMGCYTGDC